VVLLAAEAEEPYERAYDSVQNKWVEITAKNSQGRRCGRCGCNCPCTCADCLYQVLLVAI